MPYALSLFVTIQIKKAAMPKRASTIDIAGSIMAEKRTKIAAITAMVPSLLLTGVISGSFVAIRILSAVQAL
jgi:hypothetical protein